MCCEQLWQPLTSKGMYWVTLRWALGLTKLWAFPPKVCKCYLVPLFNRTPPPILDWYVIRWGSKSKHHIDTCLKEIGLHINHSTLNSEHSWEDLCFWSRSQQMCTFNNHKWIRGGLIFNPIYVHAFIANATQVWCANLIVRSWRTWKTNRITPTYLTYKICPIALELNLQPPTRLPRWGTNQIWSFRRLGVNTSKEVDLK